MATNLGSRTRSSINVETPARGVGRPTVDLVVWSYWHVWGVCAYGVIAAMSLVWLIIGQIGLRRLVYSAVPATGDILKVWTRLKPPSAYRARLLVSARISQPIMFGLVRPTIVIPADLCDPAMRGRLDIALRHELAHVQRRDALTWLTVCATRVLFFYQPLFWWMRRQVRLSQEFVADVWAAEGADSVADYAQQLLEMASARHRRPVVAGQGIGVMERHSDVYKRVEMLAQSRIRVSKWCGAGSNVAAGLIIGVLSLAASFVTVQRDVHGQAQTGRDPETVAETNGPNRIWHIMRQPNTMGLFHGFPQRMEKLVTARPRSGKVWEGEPDGGKLRLKIDLEGEKTGEIVVGFFADPRWWLAPPVQLRSFPGPGEYTIENLIPGSFQLGAMIGSLPRPDALGVHEHWPSPVNIEAGGDAVAHVLVSEEFKWHHTVRDTRNFVGDWPQMDPEQLVTVRTVDANEHPVPYCQVTFTTREGEKNYQFFHAASDQKGYCFRDDLKRTFYLILQRSDFDPVTLAERHQYKRIPELYNPANRPTIRVLCEAFPAGAGKVTGRVYNQLGQAVTGFHLNISSSHGERMGWGEYENVTMRIPVIDPDGGFEVRGLAPATYKITASAFDYRTHVYEWDVDRTFTIPERANSEVHVDIELEARELLFGLAVFDDGTPVNPGGWTAHTGGMGFSLGTEKDGSFRVAVSKEEREALNKNYDGMIDVYASGPTGSTPTTLKVRLDKFSPDPAEPLKVILPKPEWAKIEARQVESPAVPDDPRATEALKKLGAGLQFAPNGTVQKISFLDERINDSDFRHLRGTPNLEELSIHRTSMSDAALVHLKELSKLTVLELYGEPITNVGLEELSVLTTLRSLDLGATKITDAGLRHLEGLVNLETLDLSRTAATDLGLEHLTEFPQLRRLYLRGTDVTDSGLRHIAGLAHLEELRLDGLTISDAGFSRLSNLTRLKVLGLGRTEVTDRGLENLSSMIHLTSLDLGGTQTTNAGIDHILHLHELEHLMLGDTAVTDTGVERLTSLKKLRTLYVNPNITNAALVHLTAFPRLEVLGLEGSPITDQGLVTIGKLTGLTNLFLDDTHITDKGLTELMNLRNLYFLTLGRTKVTREGLERLRQLPRLQELRGPE